MTRTRAILAATSVAAATALLLAGCGSDTADQPTPTASTGSSTATPDDDTSPSPTDAPEVDAPERPEDLKDDGPAGAEAAAVYFLELDDYIMKTGDTAEFEAMSHKSCDFCSKRLDQSAEIQENSYTWTSDPVDPQVTHTYEQDAATGIWPIDVELTQEFEITDDSGATVHTAEREELSLAFEVARESDRWVIVEVGQVEGQ